MGPTVKIKGTVRKTTTRITEIEIPEDEIIAVVKKAIYELMGGIVNVADIKLCFSGEAHYGFSLDCTATITETEEIEEKEQN